MFNEETERVEYKSKINETLLKEIVAFLNTKNGGVIYIGIDDSGNVIGINNVDKTMRNITDIITDQISPRCVELVKQTHAIIENKNVIKIEVANGDKLYYIRKYGLSESGCFIRLGSSCRSLTPDEISKRYVASLRIPNKDITEIESKRKDLTFKIFRNYLLINNVHINEETFANNFHLLTSKGKYNYLAELLADHNDITINVATFATEDKTVYLKRDEFGGKCLLLAMEQAKNYINSINQTYVDVSVTPRKERKLFDVDAFEQAWINACVHNSWVESDHPGIYVYSNRFEIESRGGIPKTLTKEEFLKGKSEPVNKRLFDIFKICRFAEESGHGVPSIIKAYGVEAYQFSSNFINVVISFDKSFVDEKIVIKSHNKVHNKEPETIKQSSKEIKRKILQLLLANNRLTRSDLSTILKIDNYRIIYCIRALKKEGKISRIGSNKQGFWIIEKNK